MISYVFYCEILDCEFTALAAKPLYNFVQKVVQMAVVQLRPLISHYVCSHMVHPKTLHPHMHSGEGRKADCGGDIIDEELVYLLQAVDEAAQASTKGARSL